jgi:hypothetical protein
MESLLRARAIMYIPRFDHMEVLVSYGGPWKEVGVNRRPFILRGAARLAGRFGMNRHRGRNMKHKDSYYGARRTHGTGCFTRFHVLITPVLITMDAWLHVQFQKARSNPASRPIPYKQDQASILPSTRLHELYTYDCYRGAPRSKRVGRSLRKGDAKSLGKPLPYPVSSTENNS